MKLTIEQLIELGFEKSVPGDTVWTKCAGKRDAYFYYYSGNEGGGRLTPQDPIFELNSSDGGDTSTVYGPILTLEKFHELDKALNG